MGSVYFGLHGYEKVGTTHRHNLGPVIVTRVGATDTVTTVLADRLGSTLATVDGTTPTQRAYDPFGAVRNGDMTTKPDGKLALPRTLHGFTQHEHVDDVRLIHMGGRVFDPALGRFLSVDPVVQNASNSQALNPYSYVLNNPLSGVDPSGSQSEPVDAGECGGKGQPCHISDPRAIITRKTGSAEGWNSDTGVVGSKGNNGRDWQGVKGAVLPAISGVAADIASSAKTLVNKAEGIASDVLHDALPENSALADGRGAAGTLRRT